MAQEITKLLTRELDETWEPEEDNNNADGINGEIYDRFKSELYAVLVSFTTDEAKEIVRGIFDKHADQDGFRALVELNDECFTE